MKHILYIFIILILLASCQKEGISISIEKGYLSLSSLETEASTTTPISTRAVNSDLAIEILKADGTSVVKFDAGAAAASDKIELEAGEYKLKAYSPNYGTIWQNDEKGAPIYYKEQNFAIVAEKINYLSVQVPMINLGIKLILPDNFGELFTSYSFTARLGDRSVMLQEGETAYFNLPAPTNASLQYTLSATNSDGESQKQTHDFEGELAPGTIYEITYSLATRSLLLRVHD